MPKILLQPPKEERVPARPWLPSLEEEVALIIENAEREHQVDKEIAEAMRVTELSDSLEELAVVADRIEAATPNEAHLIETIGNVAVSGTDVSPISVLPAIEAFDNVADSAKLIRDKAKQLWQAVQKFLVAIWKKIQEYFQTNLTMLRTREASTRILLDALKNLESDAERETAFEFFPGRFGAGLQVNDKPVKDFAALMAGIKTLDATVTYAVGEYWKDIVAASDAIKASFTPDAIKDPEKLVSTLVDRLPVVLKSAFDFPGSKQRMTYGDGEMEEVLVENNQLGGYNLLVRQPYNSGLDIPDEVAFLDRIRNSKILVEKIAADKGTEVSFRKALTRAELKQLLEATLELTRSLTESSVSTQLKQLIARRAELEQASKAITTSLDGVIEKLDGNSGSEVTSQIKACLDLNLAYAEWVRTPIFGILSNLNQTLRGINALAHASFAHKKINLSDLSDRFKRDMA